jgi:hypothetical protein
MYDPRDDDPLEKLGHDIEEACLPDIKEDEPVPSTEEESK